MAKPDETVSLYVNQFQQRLPMFDRMHDEEMRSVKQDFFSHLFRDYIVFGDKPTYDGLLRGMLSDEERERLQTDAEFTRAWHIFVDMCWLKKQFTRAALIVGLLVFTLLAIAVFFWSIPHVAGPKNR
jgi:hypothetical protein